MDDLISLIFENPIFIIVLLYLIIGFFGRLGKQQKKQQSSGQKNHQPTEQKQRTFQQTRSESAESARSMKPNEQTISKKIEEQLRRVNEKKPEVRSQPIETNEPKTLFETLESKLEETLGRFEEVYQDYTEPVSDEAELKRARQSSELQENIANHYDEKLQTNRLTGLQKQYAELNEQAKENLGEIDLRQTENLVSIQKRLTREGLVDSIIMAEVLGPPRSRKPYSNSLMNRR